MIYLGYSDTEKLVEIEKYKSGNEIHKVFILSADEFLLTLKGAESVKYSDIIRYVVFYRLLQEIDTYTLIVINECLRTQNRYDLTYNCIRNFLNQTEHHLIFQQLPQIDTKDDFMILFDFDSRSRWKRQKFDADLIKDNSQVFINQLPISFKAIEVFTSEFTKRKYEKEKKERFDTIGLKDPHAIPRNLYLISGQDKLAHIDNDFDLLNENWYVARNKRLNRNNIITYDAVQLGIEYTILEFPHRFIDFSDFIKRTNQAQSSVLVADLKVDYWYFNRYMEWKDRIHETYASLQ
jgi:hypothetical protein